MESPFTAPHVADSASSYVLALYERILPQLGEALNAFHGENRGKRYWRILLGPWLHSYLSVWYDKYIHLERALQRQPDLVTITLSQDSFVVPSDTLAFACLLLDDTFNLQIYSKLLTALGVPTLTKSATISQNSLYGRLMKYSWRRKLFGTFFSKALALAERKNGERKTVVLKHSYIPNFIALRLCLSSRAGILPVINAPRELPVRSYSKQARTAIGEVEVANSEFERFVQQNIRSDIPTCFVETYREISLAAAKLYPIRPKAILSANGWYYDEYFKNWAAAASEDGALLLGSQHGGNYGSLESFFNVKHESCISDRYYSWGWQDEGAGSHTITPMPSNILIGRRKRSGNKKGGILWVTTSASRYLVQFPFLPQHFSAYLDWQRRFVEALDEDVLRSLRVRPHYEDHGWGITERLRAHLPSTAFENWNVPFSERLEQCSLYVGDHLSTTFIEALALDTPTVLFWNPDNNVLTASARPYYNELRSQAVLHDTPESAASTINSIGKDVQAWWCEKERKESVKAFCMHYARTTSDAFRVWREELRDILRKQ